MDSESIKVRYELAHDAAEMQFDPSDYEDCETAEELMAAMEELAREQMSYSAKCISHDKSELWEAVEEYRRRQLSR